MRFEPADLERTRKVWDGRWGGFVVTPERVYGPRDVVAALAVGELGEPLALVSWALGSEAGEVVTLDAFISGRGYGTAALNYAEGVIRQEGRTRARLFTTNDNIRALSLYLRRGYRLVRVHLDAMDGVRQLKPDVPLIGDGGIPLTDMLELEKRL